MKKSEKEELISINESIVETIINLQNEFLNGKFEVSVYTNMREMIDKLYLCKKNISKLIN